MREIILIDCWLWQIWIVRSKEKLKQHLPPTPLLPRLNFTPSFITFLALPRCIWHRGDGEWEKKNLLQHCIFHDAGENLLCFRSSSSHRDHLCSPQLPNFVTSTLCAHIHLEKHFSEPEYNLVFLGLMVTTKTVLRTSLMHPLHTWCKDLWMSPSNASTASSKWLPANELTDEER